MEKIILLKEAHWLIRTITLAIVCPDLFQTARKVIKPGLVLGCLVRKIFLFSFHVWDRLGFYVIVFFLTEQTVIEL